MLSTDYTDFRRLDNANLAVAHVKAVLEELRQMKMHLAVPTNSISAFAPRSWIDIYRAPPKSCASRLTDVSSSKIRFSTLPPAKPRTCELARKLRVKASDIAIVEEETPQAAVALLEATLRMLVSHFAANMQRHSQISISVERIGERRPGLVSVTPA
jgi:hypothetical protein